jgi:DNA-directed RNA polymerase subunit RPC12/RpoP
MRPLCTCGLYPVAINYYKHGKPYYRSQCGACMRGVKLPRWHLAGYAMRNTCDKCGFKSLHKEVFNVFHTDGDLNNCRHTNLKTVCSNCQRILQREGVKWRQGDLIPDL